MKVRTYVDLPNDYVVDEKHIIFNSEANVWKKIENHTRYLIEVDLPIHHFRVIEDRKIEAVLLGKEEE